MLFLLTYSVYGAHTNTFRDTHFVSAIFRSIIYINGFEADLKSTFSFQNVPKPSIKLVHTSTTTVSSYRRKKHHPSIQIESENTAFPLQFSPGACERVYVCLLLSCCVLITTTTKTLINVYNRWECYIRMEMYFLLY